MEIRRKVRTILAVVLCIILGTGCSGSDPGSRTTKPEETGTTVRETIYTVYTPVALGTECYETGNLCVDVSSTSQGYVMVKYSDEDTTIWAQMKDPEGVYFTYSVRPGDYEIFPLSSGDGCYTLSVMEEIQPDTYVLLFTKDIEVTLDNEFLPFLYPNQYVNYYKGDAVVRLGRRLSEQSSDDIDFLTKVYHYIIENIKYDEKLAKNVEEGYIPDNEKTLGKGKGICIDYASLMTAILRTQSIPAKLVVGYAGEEYHAWISVYINETGWLDNVIFFDGRSWSIIDPTMASLNDEETVRKYTFETEDYYTAEYCY